MGAWGALVRLGRGKWKHNRKGDAPALPSGCARNASACLRKSGNLKRMFRVEHLVRSAQEGSGARAMADGGFSTAGKCFGVGRAEGLFNIIAIISQHPPITH